MNDKLNQVLSKQKQQMGGGEQKSNDDIVQLVGFVVGEEEYAIKRLLSRSNTRAYLACLITCWAYLTYAET